jgi:hypothetical protein
MFRISAVAAALATVFAMGSANAVFLSVDDFNTPDAVVFDELFGGGGVTVVNGPRTIYHEFLSDTGPLNENFDGDFSSVRVGDFSFPAGRLQVINGDGITSLTAVEWTLAPGFVPAAGPVAFVFNIVGSDGVPVNFNFSLDGGATSTFITSFSSVINIGDPSWQLVVPLTAAQQAALTVGDDFALILDGSPGFDISIDSFGFEIPEPTSLALAGLALLGAGAVSRRRRAVKS